MTPTTGSATMEEIEAGLVWAIRNSADTPHELVHARFNYVDCQASLVVAAWEQVKRAVTLLEAGLSSPDQHSAEALLLMLFQQAVFHGYTPGAPRTAGHGKA